MPESQGAGVFSGQHSPVPSQLGLSPQRERVSPRSLRSPREEHEESERSSGGSPGRREHEGASEAVRVLERQVDRLHLDLEREQKSHALALSSVQARVARLEQENAQLAQELARVRQRETAREAEAMSLRREVVDKAVELDRVCREAQQQQATAMQKLQSVAQALQTQVQQGEARAKQEALSDVQLRSDDVLQQATSPLQGSPRDRGLSGVSGRDRALSGQDRALSGQAPGPAPAEPANGKGETDSSQWFLSMKANLQQFGDVEVFVEDTPRECLLCKEVMVSPYRVKPRKCPHVFHIECLLQCWEDGTCPCCRVSFAPESDGPQMHRDTCEIREHRGERRRGDDGRSHVSVHSSISQRVPAASRSPGGRRGHSLRAQHPL